MATKYNLTKSGWSAQSSLLGKDTIEERKAFLDSLTNAELLNDYPASQNIVVTAVSGDERKSITIEALHKDLDVNIKVSPEIYQIGSNGVVQTDFILEIELYAPQYDLTPGIRLPNQYNTDINNGFLGLRFNNEIMRWEIFIGVGFSKDIIEVEIMLKGHLYPIKTFTIQSEIKDLEPVNLGVVEWNNNDSNIPRRAAGTWIEGDYFLDSATLYPVVFHYGRWEVLNESDSNFNEICLSLRETALRLDKPTNPNDTTYQYRVSGSNPLFRWFEICVANRIIANYMATHELHILESGKIWGGDIYNQNSEIPYWELRSDGTAIIHEATITGNLAATAIVSPALKTQESKEAEGLSGTYSIDKEWWDAEAYMTALQNAPLSAGLMYTNSNGLGVIKHPTNGSTVLTIKGLGFRFNGPYRKVTETSGYADNLLTRKYHGESTINAGNNHDIMPIYYNRTGRYLYCQVRSTLEGANNRVEMRVNGVNAIENSADKSNYDIWLKPGDNITVRGRSWAWWGSRGASADIDVYDTDGSAITEIIGYKSYYFNAIPGVDEELEAFLTLGTTTKLCKYLTCYYFRTNESTNANGIFMQYKLPGSTTWNDSGYLAGAQQYNVCGHASAWFPVGTEIRVKMIKSRYNINDGGDRWDNPSFDYIHVACSLAMPGQKAIVSTNNSDKIFTHIVENVAYGYKIQWDNGINLPLPSFVYGSGKSLLNKLRNIQYNGATVGYDYNKIISLTNSTVNMIPANNIEIQSLSNKSLNSIYLTAEYINIVRTDGKSNRFPLTQHDAMRIYNVRNRDDVYRDLEFTLYPLNQVEAIITSTILPKNQEITIGADNENEKFSSVYARNFYGDVNDATNNNRPTPYKVWGAVAN